MWSFWSIWIFWLGIFLLFASVTGLVAAGVLLLGGGSGAGVVLVGAVLVLWVGGLDGDDLLDCFAVGSGGLDDLLLRGKIGGWFFFKFNLNNCKKLFCTTHVLIYFILRIHGILISWNDVHWEYYVYFEPKN